MRTIVKILAAFLPISGHLLAGFWSVGAVPVLYAEGSTPHSRVPAASSVHVWQKPHYGRARSVQGAYMPHAPTVTILLISSRHLGWVGIRAILQAEPDMRVVGDAQRTDEALALAAQEQPMVTMVATDIGENELLSLVIALRHDNPSSRLILLGDVVTLTAQQTLAREGIEAYLDWGTLTPALVPLIVTAVAQGEGQVLVASRAVLAQFLDAIRHSDEGADDTSQSRLRDRLHTAASKTPCLNACSMVFAPFTFPSGLGRPVTPMIPRPHFCGPLQGGAHRPTARTPHHD